MKRRTRQTDGKSARPGPAAGALVLGLVAAMLGGCSQPEPPELASLPMPSIDPGYEPAPPAPAPAPVTWSAPAPVPGEPPPPEGRSVQGRAIRCTVHGRGGETVLFLGGIHGNEPAGATLCEQLAAYLEYHPHETAGRRIVVVPAANPDGLAANTRHNARGVDVNRNFATGNRRADVAGGAAGLSEPESRFIHELVHRYRPSRIITVHQPLACVDYDGPAGGLAAEMARAAGLPVRKLGAMPGSLGSYVGLEQGIPIVTLELPREASSRPPSDLWRSYGRALLTAVQSGAGVAAK